MTQPQKAERFGQLHHGGEILVLANVWDCASAKIVELAGYPAIATSSAGVAFSLGYADGQRIPMEEMMAAVKRIAACVAVPVSADLEAGYGDVAKTAAALVESGAVGLNLEDREGDGPEGLVEIGRQCERIRTVKRVGRERGVPLVLNARTDLFLAQIGDPADRFERAIERLRAYIEAGADCVFVPAVTREDLIRRFVEELRFPLNVLAAAGTPPVARLREIGVARVSVGSGLARSAMGHARRAAEALRASGNFDAVLEGAIPYAGTMFR
jgi:2-methylisocitrate lyase-like PEP mutase family enzyme